MRARARIALTCTICAEYCVYEFPHRSYFHTYYVRLYDEPPNKHRRVCKTYVCVCVYASFHDRALARGGQKRVSIISVCVRAYASASLERTYKRRAHVAASSDRVRPFEQRVDSSEARPSTITTIPFCNVVEFTYTQLEL